jgi:hypothetical protein
MSEMRGGVLVKPSEKVKALGFKSLQEVAEAVNEPSKNLVRWNEAYPRRFELILKGLLFERMNVQVNAVFEEMNVQVNAVFEKEKGE